MTNEEAKKADKELEALLNMCVPSPLTKELEDALKMAIKALEAQPSVDCISREAVLDVINFEDKWLFDANGHNANTHIAFSGLESRVKALPPVTSQASEENIHREREQAYMLGYEDASKKFRTEPCEDVVKCDCTTEEIAKSFIEDVEAVKDQLDGQFIDAVSREAVIRLVEQYPNIIGNRCSGLISDIKHLPSVKLERPKGEWITKYDKEQGYDIAGIKTWYIQILCDKCGFIKTAIEGHTGQYHYCPNCGAEMGGTDDGREQE